MKYIQIYKIIILVVQILKIPKKLNKVFPWENFYYGAQSSYLAKEENIAGSFGIETRYPLLDFQVVQEYLHLSHKLKNKEYKSPISNFLRLNNYPFWREI